MNFTCSISGIRITVPSFPDLESPKILYHPIFTLPLTKLLPLVPKYFQGELTSQESYLLYLSLWNKSKRIQFRDSAIYSQEMPGIIARTIDPLINILITLEAVNIDLPEIVISNETGTQDFTASQDWLDAWNVCIKDYKDHYKTSTALEKLTRKETTLERYIKDPAKDISTYAHQLALWASDAGNFPNFSAGLDSSILGGQEMSLAAYWRYIIKACCKVESIWEIPEADMNELITHCEEHIPHGTIYAQELMSLLRSGQKQQNNYNSLGEVDLGMNGTVFRILNKDASVEDAAKLALIDSAPKSKPIESSYPNKLAYLKAKMNWTLAEDHRKSIEANAMIEQAEKNIADNPKEKKS